MNRIALFIRRNFSVPSILGAASLVALASCSSGNNSNGGGGSNPVNPSASITVANPSMIAGTNQMITATVSNPNGTIVCGFSASGGTFGTASLSGVTCSAQYNAMSTVSVATPVTITFTGGGATASTSLTVNPIPVPQTVSWNSSSLNVDLNGSLAISASNLTASSTCPAASVNVTVVPVTSDTAHATGSILASYSKDSSGATYGQIIGGNALPEDNTNSYTVTASCGTSVTAATLTVNDVAPTLTAISPTTVKSSSTSTTFDLIGTGFSAQSSTHNLSEWFGTVALSQLGACPTKITLTGGGTNWISSTHIQQFVSGGSTSGTWHYYVFNKATASGTGGGYFCLENAFTVTANLVVGTGNAEVIVDPQGSTDTVTASSKPGVATVIKNGAATQFTLGVGAGSPVAQGDLVFVPNRTDHTVSEIDTDSMTISTISTGADFAPAIVAADANTVYVAATVSGNASQGAILALRGGYFTKVADAPGFTDLAILGQNLLWTADSLGAPNSQDGVTSEVHRMALSGGPEKVSQLQQSVDSVKVLSDGTLLAYHVGEVQAQVLDPFTLQTRGQVSFAKGLWGFNGDYAALSDGSIGKVSMSADGLGNPVASFAQVALAPKNYGSFAVDSTSQPGMVRIVSVTHGSDGVTTPQVQSVPSTQ